MSNGVSTASSRLRQDSPSRLRSTPHARGQSSPPITKTSLSWSGLTNVALSSPNLTSSTDTRRTYFTYTWTTNPTSRYFKMCYRVHGTIRNAHHQNRLRSRRNSFWRRGPKSRQRWKRSWTWSIFCLSPFLCTRRLGTTLIIDSIVVATRHVARHTSRLRSYGQRDYRSVI